MVMNVDFDSAAQRLQCDVAAIRAVADVESAGSGFLTRGLPKILFEAHYFSRLTQRKYDQSHPQLSSPSWDRSLYTSGAAEYGRLLAAMLLDQPAALQSASWGAFQIMGANHAACGFATVQEFVTAMRASEQHHLDAFVAFLISQKIDRPLREHNWTDVARLYNGPGYAANAYHTKMAHAYQRLQAPAGFQPPPTLVVQRALRAWGYGVATDGLAGPKTTDTIRAFQTQQGLAVTGVVDRLTWDKLGKTA